MVVYMAIRKGNYVMFKEIKWTKEELKKIKKVIIKSNLTISDEGHLIVNSELFEYTHVNVKSVNPYFQYDKEIADLVYLQDMTEVERILDLSKGVKYDKTNPNHFGLIKTIGELDTDDNTEVFTILKEIIALFNTVAYDAASIMIGSCKNDIQKLRCEIQKFKNSNEETIEEMFANFKIDEILNSTNGINESPLFEGVIAKSKKNLKNYILVHLQSRLAHDIRSELFNSYRDTAEYVSSDVAKKQKNKRRGGCLRNYVSK